ncbi:MAG: ATP-dependent ligase [Pedosphaera sp.]|nr:ATP-dependent ligase [Pedosphaera sp.]
MQTTLYYREGSSDKVYQVSLEPKDNQFVVNFAFGRRGTTLQTGTKTSSPVDQETAEKIYDKVIQEKKAKGYTEGEKGTPYHHSDKQVSGIQCQLLNPIDEEQVQELIRDNQHCAQEKYDGKRMLLLKVGETVSGINRKGLVVGVPLLLIESAKRLPGDFILDGEAVGETLYAFDLLTICGGHPPTLGPAQSRAALLARLLGGVWWLLPVSAVPL